MLSEKTAECIRTAQQAGILWVAATGRSLKTASELMRTAGVSPEYLLLNGAEFRKSDGTLIFQKINRRILCAGNYTDAHGKEA